MTMYVPYILPSNAIKPGIFLPFQSRDPGPMILGKIIRISVKLGKWIQNRTGDIMHGVNLRIFLKKKYFECMIYMYRGLSTTNEQGFIYYFGIFYLKIGKFYTFFQLGKGPVMGPKISPGKSLKTLPHLRNCFPPPPFFFLKINAFIHLMTNVDVYMRPFSFFFRLISE